MRRLPVPRPITRPLATPPFAFGGRELGRIRVWLTTFTARHPRTPC
jgi:hypothetical protein